MADTTEKKTYLINVESNLNKYAEEADNAAIKVAELTAKNDGLKNSTDATGKEIEASNAALRDAKKEYNAAKKMVDLQTAANNAEAGSRKQLESVLKLQMFELGKLGNAYITNAQGMRVLNPLYVEQRNKIAATKAEIIKYDLALNDGRSNIGRYGESVQQAMGAMTALPGPIGAAVGGITRMTTAAKAFIATPLGLIIAAIVGVVALLGKAFKNSQPLMDAFHKVSAAVGATFKVLLDRVSNFTEFLGSIFNKELRQSRKEAKALNDELIGIDETMTRREKRRIRRENRKGIIDEIREEMTATYDLEKAEQSLEDREIAFIQRKAQMKQQIEEMFASTKDENLSDLQRIENLDKAIALTKEMTKIEVEFAKERARISNERTIQGNSTREELRANEELQAAAFEAEAQGFKEIKRLGSERFSLLKRTNTEAAAAVKASQDILDKELAAHEKQLKDKRKANEKAGVDEIKRLEEEYEFKQELRNRDIEAGFEYQFIKNQDNLDALSTLLDAEYAALLTSVEYTQMTNNEKLLAEEQYNQAKKQLSDRRIQQQMMELDAIANLSGSLADLFGRQTVAAKILSVSQALISTYTAGVKAMAELPLGSGPVLRFATLAGIIAAGMAQVKNILAVKVPGGGSSGQGAPTSISSVPMAQRMMSGQVGSSILTQSNLNQSQLNAIPQSGGLTVEQLTEAFRNLPAPITTIEDINARAASTNKITSRANI